jgi:hypothetical protein
LDGMQEHCIGSDNQWRGVCMFEPFYLDGMQEHCIGSDNQWRGVCMFEPFFVASLVLSVNCGRAWTCRVMMMNCGSRRTVEPFRSEGSNLAINISSTSGKRRPHLDLLTSIPLSIKQIKLNLQHKTKAHYHYISANHILFY